MRGVELEYNITRELNNIEAHKHSYRTCINITLVMSVLYFYYGTWEGRI